MLLCSSACNDISPFVDPSRYAFSLPSSLQNSHRQKGFSISLSGGLEQPVRKITEKYSRNPDVDAEYDVRKRTHFIADGQIRLDYHYGESQVTASRELYDKASSECTGYRVDPLWNRGTDRDIALKLLELIQIEKALISNVKEREREVHELIQQLARDKRSPEIRKGIYDMARHKTESQDSSSDSHLERKEEMIHVDYLSPFLAQYPPGKALTRKQALQAKEECLKSLKERLLERANIIQAHLDGENEKLKQRQAVYNRSAGTGDMTEADEEFAKFYEETMFRISILQARLARHEELALQKYAKLDQRLREDPRLRSME